MSPDIRRNLKWLLSNVPPNTVVLASWLKRHGITHQLQARYRKSGWLQAIGPGAMIRPLNDVRWDGMLYALQKNANLPIHVGSRTALGLHGKAHFLELALSRVILFGFGNLRLPKWTKADWGVSIDFHRASFLPPDIGMTDIDRGSFSIRASSPARALMEFLHLALATEGLAEARQIMNLMGTLRPLQVQELLEASKSAKVNWCFLHFAERAQHAWLKYIDRSEINLWHGTTRSSDVFGTSISESDAASLAQLEEYEDASAFSDDQI